MGLDCAWGSLLEGVTYRAGPGKVLAGEEAMLRKRFGLVLVPGVGEASRGGCQGALGEGRRVLSHR